MLKKLLSYDFKAIFKYWWVGALTTLALSAVGAGCGTILETEKELPPSVTIFATIGMVLVVLSIFAFLIFSELLIYVRFYKHLFTDEGYLTFTLPVKRHQILSSKLISGFVCALLTGIVTVADAAIILLTTFRKDIFVEGWYDKLINGIKEIIAEDGALYLITFFLEVILVGVLVLAFGVLFTYLCITFAGAISKKSKLASTILIYYAASSVSSIFMYMFYFFGASSLTEWIDALSNENTQDAILLVILLFIILFVSMLCTIAYTLNYRLLDRKLNLN